MIAKSARRLLLLSVFGFGCLLQFTALAQSNFEDEKGEARHVQSFDVPSATEANQHTYEDPCASILKVARARAEDLENFIHSSRQALDERVAQIRDREDRRRDEIRDRAEAELKRFRAAQDQQIAPSESVRLLRAEQDDERNARWAFEDRIVQESRRVTDEVKALQRAEEDSARHHWREAQFAEIEKSRYLEQEIIHGLMAQAAPRPNVDLPELMKKLLHRE